MWMRAIVGENFKEDEKIIFYPINLDLIRYSVVCILPNYTHFSLIFSWLSEIIRLIGRLILFSMHRLREIIHLSGLLIEEGIFYQSVIHFHPSSMDSSIIIDGRICLSEIIPVNIEIPIP